MRKATVISPDEVGAGTVLRVGYGLYDHVGLMGEAPWGRERSVLAFSGASGGFVELPYSQFARGRMVRVEGYPSQLPAAVVLHRARSRCGTPYSLLGFNCEHFVRYAHGLSVQSPQLQGWLLVAGLAALFLNRA